MNNTFSHRPENYICPFCLLLQGVEDNRVHSKQADIVYHDEHVTAFIASHQLINNPGQVIIIPNEHVENIYSLSDDLAGKIQQLAKRISFAIRETYPCEGNTLRLHNEPIMGAKCKGQDVLHYHLQVIPRYSTDRMYEYAEDGQRQLMPEVERQKYATMLRNYFQDSSTRTDNTQ